MLLSNWKSDVLKQCQIITIKPEVAGLGEVLRGSRTCDFELYPEGNMEGEEKSKDSV